MSDQNESPESLESQEPEAPKADDRKLAYAERDAAKKRAREAERRAEELAAKLAEHEAKLAAEAEEQARKRNDFAALEERLKKERDREAQRAADAEARIAARERSDRETALVDAVAAKIGINNRTVIKGVIKALGEQGVDVAPESMDEKYAADVAKQVREALGDLLPAKSGGSPGQPGVNHSTKKPGEAPGADPRVERVRDIAKRFSIK